MEFNKFEVADAFCKEYLPKTVYDKLNTCEKLQISDKIGKDNATGILRSVSVQLDQLLTKLEKE